MQPWDKLDTESLKNFERFTAFVHLGPNRTTAELGRHLGMTAQRIGQLAKEFDWRRRAKAWDDAGNVAEFVLPAKPVPPKPLEEEDPAKAAKAEQRAVKKMKITETAEPIEPEVVFSGASNQSVKSQKHEMVVYRDCFREKGRALLRLSDKAQLLAEHAHDDLLLAWDLRQEALQNGDNTQAQALLRTIQDSTTCFWRYCDVVRGLSNDAATHWGNATGITEILKRVYG